MPQTQIARFTLRISNTGATGAGVGSHTSRFSHDPRRERQVPCPTSAPRSSGSHFLSTWPAPLPLDARATCSASGFAPPLSHRPCSATWAAGQDHGAVVTCSHALWPRAMHYRAQCRTRGRRPLHDAHIEGEGRRRPSTQTLPPAPPIGIISLILLCSSGAFFWSGKGSSATQTKSALVPA